MNILVVSESSWNDKDSLGNSLNNWFEDWDDNFYHFFVRKVLPNNQIVSEYYNLTANDIVRGLFKFHIKGLTFSRTNLGSIKNDFEKEGIEEQKRIRKVHSKNGQLIYFLNELVWRTKLWFNKSVKGFLEKSHPDIIFALTKSGYVSIPIIKYCKKKYGTKVVVFSADDVYGQYLKCKWYRKRYLVRSVKWLLTNANRVYCCSPMMVDYYNWKFGIESSWLSKGCNFNNIIPDKSNDSITILYAGNLLYGRDETLLLIAKAISETECKDVKFVLSVLTTSTDNDILVALETNYDFVRVEKNVDYIEVEKRMNKSHYVLVAESFNNKYLNQTKYSFSTKISDAIQSGSGIIAVGSNEASTIDFLSKIDGVISAFSIEELKKVFDFIKENPRAYYDSARRIRSNCLKSFDKKEIGQTLRKSFVDLTLL